MPPGNAFDESYEELESFWQGLRWRITGPFLILLGISQAVFGWAGDSLWMRIGYSAACIAFGLFLMRILEWLSPSDRHDEADAGAIRSDDQGRE